MGAAAAVGTMHPVVAIMVCSLVLFAAVPTTTAVEEAAPWSESEPDDYYKIYIILLKPRRDGVVMDAAARLEWYKSYLPDEFTPHGEPRLLATYSAIFDGFAAKLTADELQAMSRKPGFGHWLPNHVYTTATTRSPRFLGLAKGSEVWERSSYGAGTIIGVIDSGIDSSHPSFDDTGMPPPPAKWKGGCTAGERARCNNKLIGATSFFGYRSFFGYHRSGSTVDESGHGTSCASVAAGTFVANASASSNGLASGTASGIAPEAYLAMYKVCGGGAHCSSLGISQAFDKAVSDGVDIISISISFKRQVLLQEDAVAISAYRAAMQGVMVVAAAGNGGPWPGSVRNDAPWFLTVGAGSLDRRLLAGLVLRNGDTVEGESLQTGDHAYSISEYTPLFCCPTNINGCPTDGRVRGRIVVCDDLEGVDDALRKLYRYGAAMVVVVAKAVAGSSLRLRDMGSTSVVVSKEAGDKLKAYCQQYPDGGAAAAAQVWFNGTVHGVAGSPMVASFSGRGPGHFGNILKPDVIAPGLNVLMATPATALAPVTGFQIDSGTSFSAPHVAGVAALVKSAHPDWSPAAIRSAILTTTDKITNDHSAIEDEQHEEAGFYAMGAGQVNPTKALDPGLVFDLRPIDYTAFLCTRFRGGGPDADADADDELALISDDALEAIIGDQKDAITDMNVNCAGLPAVHDVDLNLPSIIVPRNKTVQRTVTYVGHTVPETFQALVFVDPPVRVTVSPDTLVFRHRGVKATFAVTAESDDSMDTQSGYLVWVSAGTWRIQIPLMV